MKKGFVIGLATGVILTGASLVFANSQIQAILNNQIKVTLNGQVQEFRDEITNEIQYPITYKNRTYLPLRTVANLVGVDVDYDASNNTAILTNETESKELRYKKYLETYKESVLSKLLTDDGIGNEANINFFVDAPGGIIDENNKYKDDGRNYLVEINNKLELIFDGQKIADNVLKVNVAYEGNGGPGLSIYFIKDDGSLNYYGYGKLTYDDSKWYKKNGLYKLDLNYVVDFIEINSIDGNAMYFVDIDGNILHW